MKKKKLKIQFLFCLVLTIILLFFNYLVVAIPLVKFYQARNWEEIDCVIDSVETKEDFHDSRYGGRVSTSYDVTYSYDYVGRVYSSSQQGFMGGDRLFREQTPKPGMLKKCFVNPAKPSEAVIYRGLTREFWGWGFFGLLFLIPFLIVTIESYCKLRRH